ncbi:MAG TPA: hypothetical protein PLK77_15865 [Pyrinomonadaceae bacterium]|nr:hypothetical protein [Pyrinomonadaceae bacterium]
MKEHDRDEGIYGISERASLWLLIPRVALSVFVTTLVLFALFWLQFGEINSYIVLIVVLAAVFQILLVIGLRHQDDPGLVDAAPGRFDHIGSFWLVAVFFGAVFAWFTKDLANAYSESATFFHIATVVLSIVLPVVTSIPNYRYVTAANVYITLPMLVVITLIPSIVGWPSVAALWNLIFI